MSGIFSYVWGVEGICLRICYWSCIKVSDLRRQSEPHYHTMKHLCSAQYTAQYRRDDNVRCQNAAAASNKNTNYLLIAASVANRALFGVDNDMFLLITVLQRFCLLWSIVALSRSHVCFIFHQMISIFRFSVDFVLYSSWPDVAGGRPGDQLKLGLKQWSTMRDS